MKIYCKFLDVAMSMSKMCNLLYSKFFEYKVLENRNQLFQLFKRVSPLLINKNYQIVIRTDKVPPGVHAIYI